MLFSCSRRYHLHSTMLLLYQTAELYLDLASLNLHSTMLLLYPTPPELIGLKYALFTFHYASTLSSTESGYCERNCLFTFHYASTLSSWNRSIACPITHLHSTMLLLYLSIDLQTALDKDNLHSTMLLLYRIGWNGRFASTAFTFHYASTLSCTLMQKETWRQIYIPLCFYFIGFWSSGIHRPF